MPYLTISRGHLYFEESGTGQSLLVALASAVLVHVGEHEDLLEVTKRSTLTGFDRGAAGCASRMTTSHQAALTVGPGHR